MSGFSACTLLIWKEPEGSFTLPSWKARSVPGGASGKKKTTQKNLPASAGDVRDADLIPGSGRSPGEGQGNPLQYSCLENPMDIRSLASYSPSGCKELDTTEAT